MVQINPTAIFRYLSVLVYVLLFVTGFAAIVEVDDQAQKDKNTDIVDTCENKNNDDNCLENFNSLFAVAIVGFVLACLSVVAIFGEFQVGPILRHFHFFAYTMGRALFLFMCALLALGLAGDLGLAVGIIGVIVSALYFVFGIFVWKGQTSAPKN